MYTRSIYYSKKKNYAKKQKDLELKKKIEDSLDFINWKQNFYNSVLDGKTDYYSYLIDVKKD